jgi:hypothetical protein
MLHVQYYILHLICETIGWIESPFKTGILKINWKGQASGQHKYTSDEILIKINDELK